MSDTFTPRNGTDPLTHVVSVTPSDTVDLSVVPRAIKCDVAGTIKIVDKAGNETTSHFAAGVWHPVRPVRIKTGGTATGIVCGW